MGLFFCAAALLSPDPSLAALTPGDAIAAADRAGLAADRTWRSLLHIATGVGGRERSLIDDPRFFLAPEGKTNPAAELHASLEAFLHPAATGDDHAICRFPARFAWITERLGIDPSRFPNPVCREYDRFSGAVDPRAAVLVFPVGFSNSPATMFGHTLLRLDSGAESSLLSTAVSYAASTGEGFGPLYAIRGLFGLYQGYYYIQPYWEKINQYSSMENRDIWEYRLDLTREEVTRLSRHLWELNGIGSRYYFFDENCASNLLVLLEVARPSLRLTDRLSLWVLPQDTIRAVIASGIVRSVTYRPSRATRLRAMADPLPAPAQKLVVGIARGAAPPEAAAAGGSDPARTARVLDAAAEFHQLLQAEAPVDRETYAQRLIDILRARSVQPSLEYPLPPPPQVETGHRSLLVATGLAARGDVLEFALRIRPAYHDLLDPGRAYQEGAAIAFGDTHLRWREGRTPTLEWFRLIDIASLAPVDRFARPLSWQVGLGVAREELAGEHDRTVGYFSWRGGKAVRPFPGALFYALGGVETRAGGALPNLAAGGFGADAGVLLTPLAAWRVNLSGRFAAFVLGEQRDRWSAELGQSLAIFKNNALQLLLSRSGTDGHAATRLTLLWNWYL